MKYSIPGPAEFCTLILVILLELKIGNAATLANGFKEVAREFSVNIYSRQQIIFAYESVVMLKTLKVPVRVVWVFRKTQWVALFSTDLTLSVEHIIESMAPDRRLRRPSRKSRMSGALKLSV